MAQDDKKPSGPDLGKGIASSELADGGMVAGHVGDDEVLLVRHGGTVSAIAAHCTHYHGPLAEGLVVGNTIRCPWHHACFDLSTGEALARARAQPAVVLAGRGTRRQDHRRRQAGSARAETDRIAEPSASSSSAAARRALPAPRCCAGAAMPASITMLSNDDAAPVDRPNLSKDYLAGSAPEDWVPLRGDDWYAENKIDLKLKTEVTALDAKGKDADARRRQQARFRQTAAGDRRRAGEARPARRRPSPCPHAALPRRQPRHHRAGESRQARGGDRRELHRPGSRRFAARARHRGACRRTREAPARARVRAAARRFRARAARGARRHLPSRRQRDRDRRRRRRRSRAAARSPPIWW